MITTYFEVVSGTGAALTIAEALVKASVEFSVTPLPDDRYEISVKKEHKSVLTAALQCLSS